MSSLKDRVDHQRETVRGRSTNIRQRGDRVRTRLGRIDLDLGSLEWKNGTVSIQVSKRMGIIFLVAGIAGLFLLELRGRS